VNKSKNLIPKGPYCYDKNGVCPYWSLNKDREYQNNGYCSFLERGDWQEDWFSLLWDQVKECGVNEEEK
jgi:hypothetical protein